MTGLCASNGYLYLSSVNQNAAYRYTMPNVLSRITYTSYTGYSGTRDIALDPDNNVWVASSNAGPPLRLYNSSNVMLDEIDTGVVPYATGVAMDADGYLWVSDTVNDLIYKIDLNPTGFEEGAPGSVAGLQPGLYPNPAAGPVTVTFGGQHEASVNVFDIHGRVVASGSGTGSWTWNGSSEGCPVPSGTYLVLVRDVTGSFRTLRLVRY